MRYVALEQKYEKVSNNVIHVPSNARTKRAGKVLFVYVLFQFCNIKSRKSHDILTTVQNLNERAMI